VTNQYVDGQLPVSQYNRYLLQHLSTHSSHTHDQLTSSLFVRWLH